MKGFFKLGWVVFVLFGVFCFGIVVLCWGEYINVLWIVVVVVFIYFIVYCFYSLFIVDKVM